MFHHARAIIAVAIITRELSVHCLTMIAAIARDM